MPLPSADSHSIGCEAYLAARSRCTRWALLSVRSSTRWSSAVGSLVALHTFVGHTVHTGILHTRIVHSIGQDGHLHAMAAHPGRTTDHSKRVWKECKVYRPRSRSSRSLPVPLSTGLVPVESQCQNGHSSFAISPNDLIQKLANSWEHKESNRKQLFQKILDSQGTIVQGKTNP